MKFLLSIFCLFVAIHLPAQQIDTVITTDDIYRFINEVVMKDSVIKQNLYLNKEPYMSSMVGLLENSIADTSDGTYTSPDSVIVDTMTYTLNGKEYTSYLYMPKSFSIDPVQQAFHRIALADKNFMLRQATAANGFVWDKKRLRATGPKTKYSNAISLPLFSYNRKQVLISIGSLCPGLCGSGALYLYTHTSAGWERTTINSWLH